MNSDGHKEWAIYSCQLGKYNCVARFANRSDAEDHLKFLRKCIPQMRFEMMSDIKEKVSQG